MEKVNLSFGKFRDFSCERDHTCEFSWPQRNYTCSFCKKEFKSAQALGGHMNVHRRERAKLRQSSSWDFHNPSPHFSSTSSSSSSPAAKFLPYTCYSSLTPSLTSFSPSSSQEEKVPLKVHSLSKALSPRCGDIRKKMSLEASHGLGELKGLRQEDEFTEIVGLRDTKEDLDLELRLGYS